MGVYAIFYSLLTITWILDIINLPFMKILDTTYPINELAWLLIWLFMPTVTTTTTYKK